MSKNPRVIKDLVSNGSHGKPVKIDIKEAPKSPPPPKPKDK